jgi:hypothetical protein
MINGSSCYRAVPTSITRYLYRKLLMSTPSSTSSPKLACRTRRACELGHNFPIREPPEGRTPDRDCHSIRVLTVQYRGSEMSRKSEGCAESREWRSPEDHRKSFRCCHLSSHAESLLKLLHFLRHSPNSIFANIQRSYEISLT